MKGGGGGRQDPRFIGGGRAGGAVQSPCPAGRVMPLIGEWHPVIGSLHLVSGAWCPKGVTPTVPVWSWDGAEWYGHCIFGARVLCLWGIGAALQLHDVVP
ncbi:hypothetical protein R1flu_016327 [Riccia fluitans]|uniref:Uncharacterized protein n=1 Tax=Riccia fluitans TaxID=41844 RepID=A0ABD1YM06_9MARC